jgi:hypothetical protein
MKTFLKVAALAAVTLSLGACANLSPFAVDTKATPAVQQAQADTKAAIDKQFMTRLDHCTLTGQWSMGAGGIAGTSTGVSVGGGISCLAEPWATAPPAASTDATAPK